MEDKIKAKLAEIKAQKEKMLAQLNALIGAEQALTQLIESEADKDANNNSD
jgi:F0F1-type ATP synthase membrane subunit b/b'